VQFAYQVRQELVVDGPKWIRTRAFEVHAKAGRDVSTDEMRPMMQSLLAERFGLVIRREQRVKAYLALMPARTDGRLGPHIQETGDCRNRQPPQVEIPPLLGTEIIRGCGPMCAIATLASSAMRSPVVDATDIVGTFQYVMRVSTEYLPTALPGFTPPRPPSRRLANPDLPSFGEALREQLGLRTEPFHGPVEVLVIDSVHPPAED
jgi:uncharacterized protein (TIGR03435 family)